MDSSEHSPPTCTAVDSENCMDKEENQPKPADATLTENVSEEASENSTDNDDTNVQEANKMRKRVKFPDNDDIILSYHEHPSPWHSGK